MRKEPFTTGSYVHVIKRGGRGMPIVHDEADRWRFMLTLRHFNDEVGTENWFRELLDLKLAGTLIRPSNWPKQKKLVEVLCFCLMPNHFHLLLKEIREGGIAEFMKRIGIAMTKHHNEKYEQKGSIFQGAYKARNVSNDNYFRYVSAYIQVKNPFELYPGGLEKVSSEFDKMYEWASNHLYCSLADYAGKRESPIISKDLLGEIFRTPSEYKSFARDVILGRARMSEFGKQIDFE